TREDDALLRILVGNVRFQRRARFGVVGGRGGRVAEAVRVVTHARSERELSPGERGLKVKSGLRVLAVGKSRETAAVAFAVRFVAKMVDAGGDDRTEIFAPTLAPIGPG